MPYLANTGHRTEILGTGNINSQNNYDSRHMQAVIANYPAMCMDKNHCSRNHTYKIVAVFSSEGACFFKKALVLDTVLRPYGLEWDPNAIQLNYLYKDA
jgi:hypothetical protein